MDKEFDTPFNEKGVCHHHPNVQMAAKKFNGGWKILMAGCPKCIEAAWEEDAESVGSRSSSRGSSRSRDRRSRSHSRGRQSLDAKLSKGGDGGGGDEGSVSSRSTKRSVSSRVSKAVTSGGTFDKIGCCIHHPTVQVAKKKLLGGYKEYRSCPKCVDPNYDDMADNISVCSKSSRKSTTSFRSTGSTRSRKSTRSVKSNSSRKGGRITDRYGALPFDEEGYCHAHPSVRIAKKKALGGWKVLQNICPDCAIECSSQAGSTRSGRSGRSGRSKRSQSRGGGTGRYFDDSGSDTSSYKSGKSSSSRKKKIRVKDMRYKDEHGMEGRYSGDVNEDHQPHGQGKIKYKDGSVWSGVWNDGCGVHGKTTSKKSSSSSGRSSPKVDGKGSSSRGGGGGSRKKKDEWARREDNSGGKGSASIANTIQATNKEGSSGSSKKVVRKMKWADYYGDPGLYSGQVDSSNMPHGKGSMKYDHGLIQEGLWAHGQHVEGSENDHHSSSKKSSSRLASGGGERSKKSGSSSRSSGGKRMEP